MKLCTHYQHTHIVHSVSTTEHQFYLYTYTKKLLKLLDLKCFFFSIEYYRTKLQYNIIYEKIIIEQSTMSYVINIITIVVLNTQYAINYKQH